MTPKCAQANLDFHPDASPFWEGPLGQEALECAKAHGLKANTTNRERIKRHAEAMRNVALRERNE
jgi:hypothetical protein